MFSDWCALGNSAKKQMNALIIKAKAFYKEM